MYLVVFLSCAYSSGVPIVCRVIHLYRWSLLCRFTSSHFLVHLLPFFYPIDTESLDTPSFLVSFSCSTDPAPYLFEKSMSFIPVPITSPDWVFQLNYQPNISPSGKLRPFPPSVWVRSLPSSQGTPRALLSHTPVSEFKACDHIIFGYKHLKLWLKCNTCPLHWH